MGNSERNVFVALVALYACLVVVGVFIVDWMILWDRSSGDESAGLWRLAAGDSSALPWIDDMRPRAVVMLWTVALGVIAVARTVVVFFAGRRGTRRALWLGFAMCIVAIGVCVSTPGYLSLNGWELGPGPATLVFAHAVGLIAIACARGRATVAPSVPIARTYSR